MDPIQQDALAIMNLVHDIAPTFVAVRIKKDKHRSAQFTYELLNAIEYITAAGKEEARKETGPGYPGYMLEKLTRAKRYLDAAIDYYTELNTHKTL